MCTIKGGAFVWVEAALLHRSYDTKYLHRMARDTTARPNKRNGIQNAGGHGSYVTRMRDVGIEAQVRLRTCESNTKATIKPGNTLAHVRVLDCPDDGLEGQAGSA
jgi:hypothetical protein